jgi:hypothetical protein
MLTLENAGMHDSFFSPVRSGTKTNTFRARRGLKFKKAG